MHKFLLIVVLLSLFSGQFGAVSKDFGLNIYIFDVAAFLFCAIYTIYFLIWPPNRGETPRNFILPHYFIVFLIFSLWALFGLILNSFRLDSREILASLMYPIRFIVYLYSGVLIANLSKVPKSFVFSLLFLFGVVFAIGGFAQLLILPDFEVLDPLLDWDPHKNRLASTLFDPNFAGALLVLCIFSGILLWNHIKAGSLHLELGSTPGSQWLLRLRLPLVCLGVFILLLALTLTFSRSAWLMFAVLITSLGMFKYRFLLVLGLLVVFLAYFSVPRIQTRLAGITDPADSAHFRLISWKNSLEIFSDSPLVGVGFNSYRYSQIDHGFISAGTSGGNSGAGADSSFLLVLATTGLVGISLFMGALMSLIMWSPRQTRIFVGALVLSLIANSQFINSMFFPQVLFAYSMLFGILTVRT